MSFKVNCNQSSFCHTISYLYGHGDMLDGAWMGQLACAHAWCTRAPQGTGWNQGWERKRAGCESEASVYLRVVSLEETHSK